MREGGQWLRFDSSTMEDVDHAVMWRVCWMRFGSEEHTRQTARWWSAMGTVRWDLRQNGIHNTFTSVMSVDGCLSRFRAHSNIPKFVVDPPATRIWVSVQLLDTMSWANPFFSVGFEREETVVGAVSPGLLEPIQTKKGVNHHGWLSDELFTEWKNSLRTSRTLLTKCEYLGRRRTTDPSRESIGDCSTTFSACGSPSMSFLPNMQFQCCMLLQGTLTWRFWHPCGQWWIHCLGAPVEHPFKTN